MSGFWQISAAVPAPLAEAAAWLLAEHFDSAVEVQDAGTLPGAGADGLARVVLRFAEAPPETLPAEVADRLGALGLFDVPLATRQDDDDSWRDAWKAFFRRQPLSPRLWVRPPWAADGPAPAKTIIIDPGLAFGTGSHATTQTACALLDTLLASHPPCTVLDVGCGSAILGIGAALLGHRAVGVEIDPVAVDSARENLALNGVTAQVTLSVGSAEDVEGTFPIVLANIIAPVLIAIAAPIAARVAPGGVLILSGLLDHQEADVRAAYPDFTVTERRVQAERWVALQLRRPA